MTSLAVQLIRVSVSTSGSWVRCLVGELRSWMQHDTINSPLIQSEGNKETSPVSWILIISQLSTPILYIFTLGLDSSVQLYEFNAILPILKMKE